MKSFRSRLGATAAAIALLAAAPALAQTANGSPATYTDTVGATQTAAAMHGVGRENGVGAECLIGADTTCAPAGYIHTHISTAATTTIKASAGVLRLVNVNACVASATITLYDNTAASGTVIGVVTCPSSITGESPFTLLEDTAFTTGLTIVTSGATDLTVVSR